MKRNQVEIIELKSTISKRENSLEGLNNRFEPAEGRIGKLEDRSTEIIQSEKQKGKGIKKNKQNFQDLLDNIKCMGFCLGVMKMFWN